jgi:hypothetical protein
MDREAYKVYRNQTPLSPAELSSLTCADCSGILRDPVQVITCGDRFCRSCIDDLMSHGYNRHFVKYSGKLNILQCLTSFSEGPFRCPVDREEFRRTEVRHDKGCQKELQRLEIECTTPCGWKGPLPSLEAHLGECSGVKVALGTGTVKPPPPKVLRV